MATRAKRKKKRKAEKSKTNRQRPSPTSHDENETINCNDDGTTQSILPMSSGITGTAVQGAKEAKGSTVTGDSRSLSKIEPKGIAEQPGGKINSTEDGDNQANRKHGKKRRRQQPMEGSSATTTGSDPPTINVSTPCASPVQPREAVTNQQGSPIGVQRSKQRRKNKNKKDRQHDLSRSKPQEHLERLEHAGKPHNLQAADHPATKKRRQSKAAKVDKDSIIGSGTRKPDGDDRSNSTIARGGGLAKVAAPEGAVGRLSELQKRMRHKLEGAHFRMINETLYTSESKTALDKFSKEPELFDVYHRGFREQVEKWPVHPLDLIIEWLGKYPNARIADFGCGEARLAATVSNKVYSFDLVSPNPRVTACDMAHVPIKDASVHIAVFCLSLMGTNLADFLREAHRVLVPGGLMKVAEVRSRFEGEKDGIDRFLEVTRRLGFDTRQVHRSNKMFLMAEFRKAKRRPEDGVEFEAKACVYKRR